MNQKIKISQLPAKGSNLAAADLLEIAEFTGTGYISKSITGQEIIDAIPAPSVDWGDIGGTLSDQTDLNTALSGKVPTSRTLTINGTTQDLSADRTFTVSTGITIGTTAITSGTVGRVLFEGTGNVVQESANLFWDATNNRFGVGISTPLSTLHVVGSATSGFDAIRFKSQYSETGYLSTSNGAVYFASGAGVTGSFLELSSAVANLRGGTTAVTFTVGSERMRINNAGNVLINTTTDAGFRLDVNGAARFTGQTTYSTTMNFGGNTDQISPSSNSGNFDILSNLPIRFLQRTGSVERMRIVSSTGNVLINTTTDAGFRLDVNGTARVQGAFSALNASTQGIMLRNDYTQFPAIEWWATTYRAGITRETNNGLTTDAGGFAMHTVGAGTLIGGVNRFDLNASAQLQVQSTTKGFLPPRMTTTQRNAIASPAAGLMVYDTTLNVISYYNGTSWI